MTHKQLLFSFFFFSFLTNICLADGARTSWCSSSRSASSVLGSSVQLTYSSQEEVADSLLRHASPFGFLRQRTAFGLCCVAGLITSGTAKPRAHGQFYSPEVPWHRACGGLYDHLRAIRVLVKHGRRRHPPCVPLSLSRLLQSGVEESLTFPSLRPVVTVFRFVPPCRPQPACTRKPTARTSRATTSSFWR